MVRTPNVIAAVVFAALIGGGAGAADKAAAAAELNAEFLVGNWVVNDGKCGDVNAEFLNFSRNGSVVSTHNNEADAVGFWKIDGGKIYLDVLAPPSRLDEKLKDVKGLYVFGITIAPYDLTPEGFRGVGILDDQVRYGSFTRCKA
jgi:hypothetical protein